MKRITADFGLILIGFLWGFGFIVTKLGLNSGFGPLYMVSLRFLIASIILSIIFFKDLKQINVKNIRKMLLISTILLFAYLFQIIGSKYTTASKSAFYTGVNVAFVPYISWMLNRKAPDIYTYIATLFCLLGVSIISYTPSDNLFMFNMGDALVILSAVFFGAHIALTGYYSKKYSIEKMLLIQNWYVAIFSSIIFIFSTFIPNSGETLRFLNGKEIMTILYLGAVTTGICLYLQALFQRYTSSVRSAIFLSTESLFAPVFAYFVLKEDLSSKIYIGGFFILLAVILSESGLEITKYLKRKK
ncbi:DMT family transporter [Caviibacter abscessus]|uniref:DMT family transporter n=1 Tax=Caviibacter abscessus TaxID=1766719 RepID=UPI00082E4200|nr:DMT family transporter [Caviibacter abscessus]